ncbi:glycoside hydrolase family 9 protein [Photobacterium profundum]|uniref:glycoside hydrolase family 9 protein n=1 Tax=Photobacterium profundum TaxID=74109 RepID=UPI003D0A1737
MTRIVALLLLISMSYTLHANDLVVNQLGYHSDGAKAAYWITASNTKTVSLISLDRDKKEIELPLGAVTSLPDNRSVTKIDFSKINQTGWYVLKSNVSQSAPFQITSSPYQELSGRLVHALYLQRSGVVVNDPITGMQRPKSHEKDGLVLRKDDFYNAGQLLDMTGGWYDAGDFGKYVATTTITVARLLEAYRQAPEYFNAQTLDNKLVSVQLNNEQLPSVLAEATFGLEWLVKMQRGDGAVYRKVSGKEWPAKIAPWQDAQERYVYGISTPETAKFAATMAFASRVFKPYKPEDSRRYLKAALLAWHYLEQNPEQYIDWHEDDDSGSGPYIKNDEDKEESLETDADDRLWALAELYLATSKENYLAHFFSLYDASFIDVFEWKNPMAMGVWHLILALEDEQKERLVKDLKLVADKYVEQSQHSPFGVANQRFIWGSNKMTAEAGILVAWSDFAQGKPSNHSTVQSQIDYLLGANAFNLSFVTQAGTYSVRNLHHLYRIATGVSLPGYLVGGPNEKAQAGVAPKNMGMLSYIDSEKSYAVNEFAIDYNASLIGLLAVNHAYFRQKQPE